MYFGLIFVWTRRHLLRQRYMSVQISPNDIERYALEALSQNLLFIQHYIMRMLVSLSDGTESL